MRINSLNLFNESKRLSKKNETELNSLRITMKPGTNRYNGRGETGETGERAKRAGIRTGFPISHPFPHNRS